MMQKTCKTYAIYMCKLTCTLRQTSWSIQHKFPTMLFNMAWLTNSPVNEKTIANAYAAFRESQELPGDGFHTNLFSEHPIWLAALWKCAGVVVEKGSH